MCDRPQALMLFAAGFGTRMAPLTADRPKPLIPVAGRALLDHALALTDGAKLRQIVVNTHYKAQMIHDHLVGRAGIALSDEQPDILDTGGGLRHALPLLGSGPVFTMNTDAVWTGPNPLQTLMGVWRPAQMDALLLLVPRAQAVGHAGQGDFVIGDGGRLTRGRGLIYSGVQILRTEGLTDIPDTVFSLNLLWNRMLESGRIYGVAHPGGWCDVGHPGGIKLAETMLAEAQDV